jgi:uncharacterized damage-inducible protein DinB
MDIQPEPTLVELIRYNNWANQQLLALCAGLSDSQTLTKIPGAYGSIRETFGHLLYAEADYIGRITGTRPQPQFEWAEGPTLAEMSGFAVQVGEAFLELVQRVPPTQMVHEEEDGMTLDYLARQLYMQVINHGIEHRTNITTLLNSLAIPVPELDGWGYMWAHTDRFSVKEGKVSGAAGQGGS